MSWVCLDTWAEELGPFVQALLAVSVLGALTQLYLLRPQLVKPLPNVALAYGSKNEIILIVIYSM